MVKGRRIEMTKKEVMIVGALFWQRLKSLGLLRSH